jgi:D-glycero-alpha-D-manno-heptose 1-phosphate guanylyltransferase
MSEAVILAGGFGTRLRGLISDVPKPMADVAGKPFLCYVLHWLGKYDVKKVIISAGYKAEKIIEYFDDSYEGISIGYAVEEKPLGTGGAVRFASGRTKGNDILVINGDTWFPVDLKSFLLFHMNNSNLFSVALKRMTDFSRYGTVEFKNGTIQKFSEKKFCTEGLINGGIYMINRSFLESGEFPEVFSLEKDLLEKEVDSGNIKGIVFEDPFIDIGVPEDYTRAQTLFKTETNQ